MSAPDRDFSHGEGERRESVMRRKRLAVIATLFVAALVALVAAPAAALWQAGPAGFGAPRFDLGGSRQVSIGSLVSTGLL